MQWYPSFGHKLIMRFAALFHSLVPSHNALHVAFVLLIVSQFNQSINLTAVIARKWHDCQQLRI